MSRTSRLLYRFDQFFRALSTPAKAVDVTELRDYLNPSQLALFQRMQPSEQRHAFVVFQRLRDEEQTHPDLLAAALLHDVGKILSPLGLWERVVIVLAGKFLPRLSKCWGDGQPRGPRHPFVVAAQHPAWGASLAEQAGASAAVVDLIRRHHEAEAEGDSLLLNLLKNADDTN